MTSPIRPPTFSLRRLDAPVFKPPARRVERLRGRALQRMRERVAAEQPLCPDCQAEGRALLWYPDGELDHVLALHRGGTNDRENLLGRCKRHHMIKTARDRGCRARTTRRCDAAGWPIDPEHLWNR
jgi:5-methylcytosine-specific restriction protein A